MCWISLCRPGYIEFTEILLLVVTMFFITFSLSLYLNVSQYFVEVQISSVVSGDITRIQTSRAAEMAQCTRVLAVQEQGPALGWLHPSRKLGLAMCTCNAKPMLGRDMRITGA